MSDPTDDQANPDDQDPYRFERGPTTGSRIRDIIGAALQGFTGDSAYDKAEAKRKNDDVLAAVKHFTETPSGQAMSDTDKLALRTNPAAYLASRTAKPKVTVMKSTINPGIDPADDGPIELDSDVLGKVMAIRGKQAPKSVMKSDIISGKVKKADLDAMGNYKIVDDTPPSSGIGGEEGWAKQFSDFGTKMNDPGVRKALGQNIAKVNAIGSAQAIIDQTKNQPGGADQRNMFELASATTKTLLGNGTLTEGEIAQMMPKTYKGSFDKFLERISNDPVGVDAQDFVQRFQDTLNREKAVASQQINDVRQATVGTSRPALRHYKADTTAYLKSIGLTDPEFNPAPATPAAPAPAAPAPTGSSAPDSTGHVVGKQYRMKDGNMATYVGNGQFN